MWAWLVRRLVALFPVEFRRRYGADVEHAARDTGRWRKRRRGGDSTSAPRTGVGAGNLFVLGDLVVTLIRVWTWRVGTVGGSSVREAGRVAAGVRRDVSYAVRQLVRRPLYAIVVVGTLALAIGANTAVFTVTRALLLKELPYAAPEQVVRVAPWVAAGESPAVVAKAEYYENASANLVVGSEASRVGITQVSSDFFRVLGVEPMIGRDFPADREGDALAVLSHGLWVRAFGGDPSIIGRSLHLSGRAYQVIGVAPREMDFPPRTEVWVSLPFVGEFYALAGGRSNLARLRPGVEPTAFEAMLRRAVREEMAGKSVPEEYWLPKVFPLRSDLTRGIRLPLLVLTGAAAMILLLGCVNIAGMTVMRLAGRDDELAVRRALGAGRSHVFGQLMIETLVPAAIGGGMSMAVAGTVVPLLRSLLPSETPGLAGVTPDASLVQATGAAALLAGLLAGSIPALAATRGGRAWLGAARATQSRRRSRLQAILVASELALAVVLVTGAMLLGRSLSRLHDVPLGFDVERVLTFDVRLPTATYPDSASWQTYTRRATESLAAIPGVTRVGASTRLPLAEGLSVGYHVRSETEPESATRIPMHYVVSGDYFAAMGVTVLEGRTFDGTASAEPVVVLSRTLATTMFPEGGSVGRKVVLYKDREGSAATVVGVVDDVRMTGPDAESDLAAIYEPFAAAPWRSFGFAVRVPNGRMPGSRAVREALAGVDPAVPPFALRTTSQAVAETLAARRAVAVVSAAFAASALVLAALGIYGVVASAVSRRRREIGIRMAVGAEAGAVLALVIRDGLRISLPGIAAGMAGAVAVAPLLAGLLYDIDARDPGILGIVMFLTTSLALVATYIPARRAARTSPSTSLRAE